MDNFNALSKSAILTKLALDGYFIDLLTLNSFIKEWQIEAIYENEFNVEFFDNTSYEIILNNLKEKYNKTKETLDNTQEYINEHPGQKEEVENIAFAEGPAHTNEFSEGIQGDIIEAKFEDTAKESTEQPVETKQDDLKDDLNQAISLDDLVKEANNSDDSSNKQTGLLNQDTDEVLKETYDAPETCDISLDEIQNVASKEAPKDNEPLNTVSKIYKPKETIMPRAMKRLTPAPVSPFSALNVNKSYFENEEYEEEAVAEYNGGEDEEYVDILEAEKFSPEEIEKAENLIKNTARKEPEKPESSYEEHVSADEFGEPENKPVADNAAQNQKEEDNTEKDELDLMQLAQTFAQNLTGAKDAKDVPPADLEEIFSGSYTEPFEDLQDFVRETADEDQADEYQPEEYKSLQEEIPSDIVVPEVQANVSLMPKEMNASNLTAQDIREIIRDEISKQTANVVPKPQNGEDIREIIREIVKQTTDIAPQNAFKLDISHGTLDMIAKSIAKKIAAKLNSYYKLNSSKQNAKLQLFRERTIELKEKNQILADENKKLRILLAETNRNLNSYKPTIFGLFKFTGKKRRR